MRVQQPLPRQSLKGPAAHPRCAEKCTHRPEPDEAVEVRDLAAYDEIFGIDLGQQPALLEVAS